MKTFKEVTIIEGRIGSSIDKYIREFKEINAFDHVSDEAILYALLEYSKYPRPLTSLKRIGYVFEKACEYEGIDIHQPVNVIKQDDGYYNIEFKRVGNVDDDLPF